MRTVKDLMSAQAKILWGQDDKSQHRAGKRTTFPEDISSKENRRMVSGPKTRAMGASKDDIWECTTEVSAEKVAMVSLWKRVPGCGQSESGKGDTGIWA